MCKPNDTFLSRLPKEGIGANYSSSSCSDRDEKGGFRRCKHEIESGLLFLTVIYGSILWMNPAGVTVSSEFCKHGELECQRPDLLAYKVVSGLSMCYMGLWGIWNWHFNPLVETMSPTKALPGSPEQRVFGYLRAADQQNVASLVYQVWDFFVSLTIAEHCSPLFLVHHVLAAITAYCSLEYQMVPYYSVFYGGCSEVSSIFLVVADLDQFFPPATEDSFYGVFILACKGLFAITFTIYRVFGWIRYSFPLWHDVLHVLGTGSAEKQRPGKTSFLYVFLCLNVTLGALQIYWFGLIGQQVAEMLNN